MHLGLKIARHLDEMMYQRMVIHLGPRMARDFGQTKERNLDHLLGINFYQIKVTQPGLKRDRHLHQWMEMKLDQR